MLNSASQKTFQFLANLLYPVGSYYITESQELDSVDKMNAYFGGTWERLEAGRFLEAGTSVSNKEAGLPNITGVTTDNFHYAGVARGENSGCFQIDDSLPRAMAIGSGSGGGVYHTRFNASLSNSIYGNSGTVQPKSRVVYIYKRTSVGGV